MKNPWMKFYPTDWQADPELRFCSLSARGLWIEMLAIMHKAQPRGDLVVEGKPIPSDKLANMVGATANEVQALLEELESAGVFSRRKNGVIYSRRMERDENKTRKLRENGKKGGNPSLSKQTQNDGLDKGVDKPTEARSQKPDIQLPNGNCTVDPEKLLFERGKEVLGKGAGGFIAKLLKSQNGDAYAALGIIETAAEKQDTREYVGAVIRIGPESDSYQRTLATRDRVYARLAVDNG